MKEKSQKKIKKYQKPIIVAASKGRSTYGCPACSEKDCGVGYRK